MYFCISVLFFYNGEATGFFPNTRGLRQGDPLSSLLFILIMETLSRLIFQANEAGFLEGIHINSSHSEDVLISHLLFANET